MPETTNTMPVNTATKKKYKKNLHYKKKWLNVESQCRSLTFMFYPEQVITVKLRNSLFPNSDKQSLKRTNPQYWNTPDGKFIVEQCKDYLKRVVQYLSDEWAIAIICHDRDMDVDKIDKLKAVHKKTHFHCVMWRRDGKRFRVRQAVKALGLNFNGIIDADLLSSTFSYTRNLKNSLQYLLHMTYQSEHDGKEPYKQEELITNLSDEELNKIYHLTIKDRLSDDDWDDLSERAYKCGLNLHDFNDFADRHFNTRQQSQSPFRVVRQHYERGLRDGIARAGNIPRLNIILKGDFGTGKSFATQKVLNAMKLRIYKATPGNGKYDGLSANDDVLLYDDKYGSQLMSVCVDSPVLLYRRNHDASPWCGNCVISLTNSPFKSWILDSMRKDVHVVNGEIVKADQEKFRAVYSRFYCCEVIWPDYQPPEFGRDHSRDAYIKVTKKYDRGTPEERKIHNMMFDDLIPKIENEIKNFYQIMYNDYWNKYHDKEHQQKANAGLQPVSSDGHYDYYFDNTVNDKNNATKYSKHDNEIINNIWADTFKNSTDAEKSELDFSDEEIKKITKKHDDSDVGHDANALTPKEIDDLANSFGISK